MLVHELEGFVHFGGVDVVIWMLIDWTGVCELITPDMPSQPTISEQIFG
jgi:hypothetical protein